MAKQVGIERHGAWISRRYDDSEGYVKGDMVTHAEQGGQFFLLDRGIVETDSGVWVPAYTYQSARTGEIFTTAKDEFEESFERVG